MAVYSPRARILVFATMGFGFFKGMYDANIWASLHGVAPVAMASASGVWGMGMCLSATSAVYAAAGVLLVLGASRWMMRKAVTHAA